MITVIRLENRIRDLEAQERELGFQLAACRGALGEARAWLQVATAGEDAGTTATTATTAGGDAGTTDH